VQNDSRLGEGGNEKRVRGAICEKKVVLVKIVGHVLQEGGGGVGLARGGGKPSNY